MRIDYSKFKIIASVSRTDAQLAKILLEQSGIEALLKQDSSTEALSVVRGNAVLPFEAWGVYVAENNAVSAKNLLEGVITSVSVSHVKESAARRAIKPFIWLFLILFFGGILFVFVFMLKEIMSQGNI